MTQQKLEKSLVRTTPIAWLLVAVSLSLSGCGLLRETHHVTDLARRTTFLEPRFYDYIRSDKVAQREARLLAEQAWGELSQTMPNASADYQNGFTEGFADYLYRGGEGEPPVIPPRGYWNLRFLNQFGRLTINDWYEGFRHGVQVCKSTGLRNMWLVPTSLLGGLDEEDSLPSSENQLWSADPDLNMNQMLREPDPEPEPDLESLSNPDTPPVPEPNPESKPESAPSPELATERDTEDTDTSDATKQPSAFGLEPSDDNRDLDSRDPLFEPTKTDPLDDVLSPEPTTPDAGKMDDDIFGSPEGTFDSSDSFEVDDLNFDFEGSSHRPKSNGPLAIRVVNPVAKIPSYLENSNSPIAVTSGQYDEGIPLPPQGMIITSSDNVAPPPPNRAIQTNQTNSRPAAQRPLPLKINPSQTQAASPYQNRASASARTPNAIVPQQRPIGSSLTVTDLMMEAQPIEQQPSSKPMTMWLDDNPPQRPNAPGAPPVQDEVSWEPFEADNSSTGLNPANGTPTGNRKDSSFDEDFGALNYEDILDERKMQRSTEWNPKREELPLRVGTRTITNPHPSQPKPSTPRMQLRAEGPSKPTVDGLKMGIPSELNELPKIYVRPNSSGVVRPITPPNDGHSLKMDLIEEPALRWRDR